MSKQMAKMAKMADFSLLSLYRQILRAHGRHLSAGHRELGDSYVRTEFRLHRNAKPEFLVQFERQWRDYLKQVVRGTKDEAIGRDMSAAEIEALSDEQKVQLINIYDNSRLQE